MSNAPRRYDPFWELFKSDELKRMTALWGGSNKLRKDECITYLRAAFADPRQVDAALARMHPQERAALGLLKRFGGAAELQALAVGVYATGTVAAQARNTRSYDQNTVARGLVERGIVMRENGSTYISYNYGGNSARFYRPAPA